MNPIRQLIESPAAMLGPHVREGMTVVEPGCGMGYFTLPMARMVGASGRVVAVDLQPRMLEALRRRAARAGLTARIATVSCTDEDLGLGPWALQADVAVAIHMAHEAARPDRLFRQLFEALRPGGTLLLVEPKGHVSSEQFEREVALAEEEGFERSARPAGIREPAAALIRPLSTPSPDRT